MGTRRGRSPSSSSKLSKSRRLHFRTVYVTANALHIGAGEMKCVFSAPEVSLLQPAAKQIETNSLIEGRIVRAEPVWSEKLEAVQGAELKSWLLYWFFWKVSIGVWQKRNIPSGFRTIWETH